MKRRLLAGACMCAALLASSGLRAQPEGERSPDVAGDPTTQPSDIPTGEGGSAASDPESPKDSPEAPSPTPASPEPPATSPPGDEATAPTPPTSSPPPPSPKAVKPVDQDEEEDEETVPPARDRVAGHFSLAASVAVAIPGGDLQGEGIRDDAISQPTLLDTGAGFGLDLRFGLSRTVMLGIGGDVVWMSPPSSCTATCGGTAFAVEVFASYHPVQGLALDPWVRYGMGYRGLSIDDGPTYHGLDWLRLRVGGDYFVSSHFAIGPFVALDLGHYFDRSGQAIENSVHHMDFLLGIAGTLDLPGK